ncbi:hypothetical protein [Oscillibacter ruminantium]|uniref:hypothetical protein n=1 Tax=Oscillibacter ruminantium TaxID=1263547 RepID=UPI001181B182|nr:hypothetical protein [Oscillibacter ruminantium]
MALCHVSGLSGSIFYAIGRDVFLLIIISSTAPPLSVPGVSTQVRSAALIRSDASVLKKIFLKQFSGIDWVQLFNIPGHQTQGGQQKAARHLARRLLLDIVM